MDPSQPYFPITHKEKKKSKKKDSSTGVFCEFCRIFKNTFFKNISGGCFWRWTRRNQTTAHDIPIEQMLSLNDSLWIILATHQNGHVVTVFYSRPKVKMRQNLTENFIFVFLFLSRTVQSHPMYPLSCATDILQNCTLLSHPHYINHTKYIQKADAHKCLRNILLANQKSGTWYVLRFRIISLLAKRINVLM